MILARAAGDPALGPLEGEAVVAFASVRLVVQAQQGNVVGFSRTGDAAIAAGQGFDMLDGSQGGLDRRGEISRMAAQRQFAAEQVDLVADEVPAVARWRLSLQ